jgi:hypothetical protein
MCSLQTFIDQNGYHEKFGDIHLHTCGEDIVAYNADREGGLKVHVHFNLQNVFNYIDNGQLQLSELEKQLRSMEAFVADIKSRLLCSLKSCEIPWKVVLYRQTVDLVMWPEDDVDDPLLSDDEAAMYEHIRYMDAIATTNYPGLKQVFIGDGQSISLAEGAEQAINEQSMDRKQPKITGFFKPSSTSVNSF